MFPIMAELVAGAPSHLHGVLGVPGRNGAAGLGCAGVGGELGGVNEGAREGR